jgi:hypothetical protein
MEKLPKYLLVFAGVSVLFVLGYFLIVYIFDGSTSTVLQSYQLTKDKEMVRDHLRKYRGDAEGHETRIVFAFWGVRNQQAFLEIVEGFEVAEKEQFCRAVGFAVTDSSQDEEFEAAFSGFTSPCLQSITAWIAEHRQWQEQWKQRQRQ